MERWFLSPVETAQSPDLLLWIPDPRFRNAELCCGGATPEFLRVKEVFVEG